MKDSNNNYTSADYPEPDGYSTRHRPRRDYWGNVYDRDTFDQDRHNMNADCDSALFDAEDDNDSYYESDGYV